MSETVRFGILIPQDAPFSEQVERWQAAEDLGFDAAYVADHTGDYRNLEGYWLDGWTLLTHVAAHTTRLRVGTLVSNPLLHHPLQLAKQAVAVDHLSNGRLELGLGMSIAGFDHAAVGQEYWDPKERAARFAEYVELLDGVLCSRSGSFRYAGSYFRTETPPLTPAPRQAPRPPLTLGGQSPTVLRMAARHADCWNTHGPFGRSLEEILELTATQNQRLDALCRDAGRSPHEVRRSLLLFDVLDAWASPDRLEQIVTRFRRVGMHEFVMFWPPERPVERLQEAATLMAALRVDRLG